MGCPSCGGNKNVNLGKPTFKEIKPQNNIKVTENLISAAKQQPDKFRWFRDGITGIVKCFTGNSLYSDEDIIKNRDICRECEFSTKQDGKLVTKSQCMAPDPDKDNAPCACFIVCKTQNGKCQLNKWQHVSVTISAKPSILKDDDVITEI